MAYTAPPVSGTSWLRTLSTDERGDGSDRSTDCVVTGPPAEWRSFRGQVTVVVFWSLGCEASLLQLRSVQELVAKAEVAHSSLVATETAELDDSDPVISDSDLIKVLAVHTPRFPYEDDEALVRTILEVEQITVPVVHDPEYVTWNRYNPGGWPATVLIDKVQDVVGLQVGTAGSELLASGIESALSAADPKPEHHRSLRKRKSDPSEEPANLGDTTAATATDEVEGAQPSHRSTGSKSSATTKKPDSFSTPTAVSAHLSGLIAIADTANDRVLIGSLNADLDTFVPKLELTDVGRPGGLAIRNESELYVIERTSATVLGVDLSDGSTTTVARDFIAPTALCVDRDGSIVVADAGSEQLFRTVVARAGEVLVGPIAGTGATGFEDGPAAQATLAQPVAVARSTAGVVFCDAASSNIRLLTDNGTVLSVTQNDFFQWGLVDGPVHQARLQRPSGLAVLGDGSVVVADTGNNKLRMLRDKRLETLGVSGLDHPTGLATVSSSLVAVADSGNDRVLLVSPVAKEAWALKLAPAMKTVSRKATRTEVTVS